MARITDLLAGEQADAVAAETAARLDRSLTGYPASTSIAPGEPIAGERVAPLRDSAPGATTAAARTVARKRVPFGAQSLKLAVPPRPGYKRHWFNDEPGRVQRAELAGYTLVKDSKGQPVARITGKAEGGRGRNSYLMEIPQDWYEEDQAAEQAALEDRLAEIRHGKSGPGGNDPTRYVPQQGIKMTSGTGRRV